jgi:hypothetical protein
MSENRRSRSVYPWIQVMKNIGHVQSLQSETFTPAVTRYGSLAFRKGENA